LDPAAWICTGIRRRAMPETPGALRWLQGNLDDPDRLANTLAQVPGITHVLYAPAPTARSPEAYASAYPQGLQSLLGALSAPQQLQRLVLVDSTAVWRSSADWVDEQTPTDPEDFRGQLMLEAEAILRSQLPSARFPQASGIALRLSGLYGPERLRLIDGLRTRRITAPDGPGHWANRIHIDDAAKACAHLLEVDAPLACYIGTDDTPLPTADLYDALASMTGAALPARTLRPADGKRLRNRRLRDSGWVPQWPDTLVGYAHSLNASEASEHPM
ncbi:MAG TPA: hypothetical protein VF285_06130, partial [Castellaniella sp.]|uniref:hypothetical protein n=1 Tax=Castellaniella sp. TaxID=1955812 RepID=UPI002EE82D7D